MASERSHAQSEDYGSQYEQRPSPGGHRFVRRAQHRDASADTPGIGGNKCQAEQFQPLHDRGLNPGDQAGNEQQARQHVQWNAQRWFPPGLIPSWWEEGLAPYILTPSGFVVWMAFWPR